MVRVGFVLFALLSATVSSEASMNDRVVPGTIIDPRISGCGVVVSAGSVAMLRPFIETSSDLSGNVRLGVTKRSRSGSSHTSQSWNFSGGTLGQAQVGIDLPAEVSLQLDVVDGAGTALCRLEQDLVLGDDAPSA